MFNLLARQLPRYPAVTQADHTIGAGLQLAQSMADVDDRHAGSTQFGDHLKQPFRLRQRQAAGGFVHDDDARIHRKGTSDFHHLPLCDRQRSHRRIGRKIRA